MTETVPTFRELKDSGYDLALYRRWFTGRFGRALAFGSSYTTYATAVAHARVIAKKSGTTVPAVLQAASKEAGRGLSLNTTRHIHSAAKRS